MDTSGTMDIINTTPNINKRSKKTESKVHGKSDPNLNFSQNSKEKSDEGDNHEEILSKDTDTNDDMTRLEERESLSPSLPSRKGRRISKTISLTDYEQLSSIAQDRKRRVSKKPINSYENKIEEEKEKLQRKPRTATKKQKAPKAESSEGTQMEIEKPVMKPRHEIGYEWKDLHLAFRDALNSLSQEEFISFIKMVSEDKPECVSFEKGYLELKITGSKIVPPVSENEYTKTNQMLVQNKTYLDFLDYIEKIKGNKGIEKPKGKKNTKGK